MSTITATTLILTLLPLASLSAQKPVESPRLTMPKIHATFGAYGDVVALIAGDSALRAKFKTVRQSLPDTNGRDTMGLTAGKLAPSDPRVAGAFRKAGITPEEAVNTFETLLGCVMGEAMLQSMKGDTSKLPADVAANIAFYKQNKAEIQAAFHAFASKTAPIKDLEEDDEEEDRN